MIGGKGRREGERRKNIFYFSFVFYFNISSHSSFCLYSNISNSSSVVSV